MRVCVISGSPRPEGNTLKAVHLLVDALSKNMAVDSQLFDLATIPLSTTHGFQNPEQGQQLIQSIKESGLVILGTPEYDGSFSGAMKLMIEQLGYPSALSNKPVVVLGVATGAIGAVKATEHLKSVCSHVGAIILPFSISLARVHEALDPADPVAKGGMERTLTKAAEKIAAHFHTPT